MMVLPHLRLGCDDLVLGLAYGEASDDLVYELATSEEASDGLVYVLATSEEANDDLVWSAKVCVLVS